MDKKLEDVEFVIFDTETTGLEPINGDRIVEIAAIRFKAQERMGKFHNLVNSSRQISPKAFEINRISPAMLKDAPQIKEVLPRFLDFIQGSCLCSYNLPFDLGFLNNELKLAGFSALDNFGFHLVDILAMARILLPELKRHALGYVARSLGIENPQEHRAFADVELAWQVFERLKVMLREKRVNDYESFLKVFSYGPAFLRR